MTSLLSKLINPFLVKRFTKRLSTKGKVRERDPDRIRRKRKRQAVRAARKENR